MDATSVKYVKSQERGGEIAAADGVVERVQEVALR